MRCRKAAAIGGVWVGSIRALPRATTNVLLEVAYFQRESIRQTSRKLNLATEASYAISSAVSISTISPCSNRAADLIIELAGGELKEFIDVYPTKSATGEVRSANIARAVERLTGLNVVRR